MLAPSSKMSRHIFIQSLLFAVLFVILLIWISSPQARFSSDTVSTAVSTADSTVVSTAVSTAASTAAPARLQPDIPNYAHFVFLLEKPESDFPFVFFQYLSMYAACILERRSDIGRVLYPVVRDMYNQGVISLDEK
ncbi:glycosyltransferase sugar-binding domain-containing protein [Hirsutella rhossiliensis]